MKTEAIGSTSILQLPDAPDMPGLTFRHFRDADDWPKMHAVSTAARLADQIDFLPTLEGLIASYTSMKNFDLYKNVLIAEVDGNAVAFNRLWWYEELDGPHIYQHMGWVHPDWRGRGIGTAMVHQSEQRAREIASSRPLDAKHVYEAGWGVFDSEVGLRNLLEKEGYQPVRYSFHMVRPNLEGIPDCPLPPGVEARPVQPEHYKAIWAAEEEAFRDHWGAWQSEESDFDLWIKPHPLFQPNLWQVAWDGDEVVGMVRNFINYDENERFNRKRGYTENISVRRPWRKKGVAKALIARSFQMHKDLGMEEAALGVDTENPNGALQLYEGMGFKFDKHATTYRKPFDISS